MNAHKAIGYVRCIKGAGALKADTIYKIINVENRDLLVVNPTFNLLYNNGDFFGVIFERTTREEYFKSINIKKNLIELAKHKSLIIKLETQEDAEILDALFFEINHLFYKKNKQNNYVQKWISGNFVKNHFKLYFDYNNLSRAIHSTDKPIITIKELLDYV